MKKLLTILLLLFAVPVEAQITIPNTFSPNTVAQSALVNANFSALGSLALNRAGGNLTGNITADGGVTIDGIDIGATICTTCDPTFDDVTIDTLTAVSATLSGTLAVNSTSASAIDVAGGIQAGSGNVAIVGTDGRIPAISSTTFASLSGANLTGILEANIADGSVFPRLNGTEVITGSYTIGTNSVIGLLTFNTPNGSNAGVVFQSNGSSNGQIVQSNTASFWDAPGTQTWRTVAGVTRASLSTAGLFTAVGGVTNQGAEVNSNTVNGGALSGGENHNVAPTGIADAAIIRYSGNAITPSKITGITTGAAGRRITFCNTGTDLWSFKPEDADSTSSNRIAGELSSEYVVNPETCTDVVYDGSSNRWRVVAGAQPMSPL